MTSVLKIKSAEWRFVFFLSLVVVTITIIPLIIGCLVQDEGHRFVGYVNNHEDMNSYFSWMKQAKDGNFLFEEKYSTEDFPRNIFIVYFLIGGFLSRFSGLSIVIVHQVMRVITGIILLFASYAFCGYFISDVLKRKVAFLLICFSSGFGFYFASLYHFFGFTVPNRWGLCDQNHPQAITFWGIDWTAHAMLTIAMMLVVFLLMIECLQKNDLKLAVYAGLLGAIINLIHPPKIVLIFLVIGSYSLYLVNKDRKKISRIALGCIVYFFTSSLGMLPGLITIINNPLVRLYFRQPVFYNIFGYLLGIGFVAFVALWAICKIIKERRDKYYFLAIWVICVLVLLQSPLGFRMRMTEGLHIALCVLCAMGLFWLFERWQWFKGSRLNKTGVIFVVSFVIVSSPSNLMHIINDVRKATKIEYPHFLSRDFENALKWVDENIPAEKAVLASREVGSFIPARTGMKTFVGHWAETLDIHHKTEKLNRFMSVHTSDRFRIELLKKNNIEYFLISEFERKLGGYDPAKSRFFKEIHRSGSVIVYLFDAV